MKFDRIGAGLTAMAMLAWFLWPVSNWQFEPEPAFAFGIALVVWVWREFAGDGGSVPSVETEPAPHPHDLALGKRIRETLDEQTLTFLRDVNFGIPFESKKFLGIEKVSEVWSGVNYELEDEELNIKLSLVKKKGVDFLNKIAMNSGPTRTEGMLSVPLDEERANDFFSEMTFNRINELQRLSRETLEAIEDLQKAMRRKMPGIYG